MAEVNRRVLWKVGLSGCLIAAAAAGCGTDQSEVGGSASDLVEGASEVADEQPNLDRPKYTVVPGTGPAQVEQFFEVLITEVEEGEADVYIYGDTPGEGLSVFVSQGESVTYVGWTFEFIHVGRTLVHFIATSPDGEVYPN